jgi:ABC-type sugar transport system ATPase subunit
MAKIDLSDIKKTIGDFTLHNVNLTIPNGKTIVILGPSGCGKTTLLRIIAGLERPDAGTVKFDDVDVKNTPPDKRNLGMVFQNYALYPHFTARENILSHFLFKKADAELGKIAEEKLKETVNILGIKRQYLLDNKPHSLSGGEKQMVAMGRCITRDPSIMLLDEPFGHLDHQIRQAFRVKLKQLLQKFDTSVVYVTHDQQEAHILGDFIAIMNKGKIIQFGTYDEMYDNPDNAFVAEFLNKQMELPAINFIEGGDVPPGFIGTTIGVRPEDIEINVRPQKNYIRAKIFQFKQNPLHKHFILGMTIGKSHVYAKITENLALSPEQKIWVHFRKFHRFDKKTEETINP